MLLFQVELRSLLVLSGLLVSDSFGLVDIIVFRELVLDVVLSSLVLEIGHHEFIIVPNDNVLLVPSLRSVLLNHTL